METIIENRKLKYINKPARYVGGEVNQIIKNDANVANKVILCYPNTYERGMSNYYVKLLYSNINLIEDVYCTRCFACDIDFENLLKKENYELYGLEDKKSIRKSDLLIFVIDDELDFTNVINMLKLANIQIDKSKRAEANLKVIAFCPNSINTKPIDKVIDVTFTSENTLDSAKELIKYIGEYKKDKVIKKDNIEIKHITNEIVPSIKINNLSIIIDLEEEINMDNIVEYIKKCIEAQGVTKVSFINQDKIDSYKFCELIYKIKANVEDIRISAKGLDFSRFDEDVISVLLSCMEKSILEFDVVTCSKKLKDKLGIGVDKNQILNKIKCVFKNNWSSVKLVFTIGFPEETYEDIDDIFAITNDIVSMYSKYRAKDKLSILLELDYYIPSLKGKNIYSINTINRLDMKTRYIMDKKLDSVIRINIDSLDRYITKWLLKNGDENLEKVILSAHELGARFDGDISKYNKNAWDKAIFDNNEIIKNYSKDSD